MHKSPSWRAGRRQPPEVPFANRALACCLFTVIALSLATSTAPCARADEPVQTDIFTSGAEGYHTYRIPALVVTNKGTLLAFCEGRKTSRADHGDIDMLLRRSTDGGKTWLPMQLVHEEGGDAKITIGNPCPVIDRKTGTIWLPFTRDNDDVFVTSSDDDGLTWAKPRRITVDVKLPNWGWYATGPGNAIQLRHGPHQGRLVFPCDHRVTDGSQSPDWKHEGRSHVFYSDDHGQSWKLGGVTDWAMNECAVVELADGTLMLNMRSYRGKNRRGVATSKDGGLTWSEVKDDPTLVESVCQASFIRFRDKTADEPGILLFSNPATPRGRHHLTIRASFDEGQTWPISRLLYEGSSAYSCLAVLSDGRIGIVYERDNYGKITFASFSWDWLHTGHSSPE
jgi:sialidase-1